MPGSLAELTGLLRLEPVAERTYRGRQPATTRLPRVFGGQVMAQALVAASETVPPGRLVHSLHVRFLAGGDTRTPVDYEVVPERDGGTFSSRAVLGRQGTETLIAMTASFQAPAAGVDHQLTMPATPGPEAYRGLVEVPPGRYSYAAGWLLEEWPGVEVRLEDAAPSAASSPGRLPPGARHTWWARADGALPDEPGLHAALLCYLSDLMALGPVLAPHGVDVGNPAVLAASLDHSMWFHRPVRLDRWHLFEQFSPSASGERGLSMGHVYAHGGALVATVVQEAVVRRVGEAAG